jgi:hypothetical protein
MNKINNFDSKYVQRTFAVEALQEQTMNIGKSRIHEPEF